jgi:hypothetical protein
MAGADRFRTIAKAVVGLRHHFRPTYALANVGHPSIPSDAATTQSPQGRLKLFSQFDEKRSLGCAHHFRPTYAWANVGHPSIPCDADMTQSVWTSIASKASITGWLPYRVARFGLPVDPAFCLLWGLRRFCCSP